jgi:hypothetical protein
LICRVLLLFFFTYSGYKFFAKLCIVSFPTLCLHCGKMSLLMIRGSLSFCLLCFCGTKDWTLGLGLAGQALYHLSHAPSSFVFSLLSGSHASLSWPGTSILLSLPLE